MKLSNALLFISASYAATLASARRTSAEARLAQAAQERKLQQDIQNSACFSDEDFTVYFKGKCDFDSLVNRMNLKVEENDLCINTGKEEVMLLVGEAHPDREPYARMKVDQMCQKAMDDGMTLPSKSVPWEKVANKGDNFDKQYYDGNTYWNEEFETNYDTIIPGVPSNRLSRDAERVGDLYETVAERLSFQWPDIDNFETCELRAAMCCWVSDRQANDNNGNCATPYDSRCLNADPADNTEICGVDMERSGTSSIFTDDGFSFYPGNAEGSTHCHGFAWGQDLTEPDYRYAANNLFYVSMYDHMYQRGYVRNVPGAPMCGCLEKMPVVTRSDCTEIEALEIWKFEWDADAGTEQFGAFTASLDRSEIEFNACRGAGRNNDLESFYERLYREGRASLEERQMVKRTLVGNDRCEVGREQMMYLRGREEVFPATPFDTTGNKFYTITTSATNLSNGAFNNGVLYVAGNDVRLTQAANSGLDTAQFYFTKTDNNGQDRGEAMVTIQPKNKSSPSYLASNFNGHVEMHSTDGLSGREKWYLQKVPDSEDEYYIKISGGTSAGDVFLSVNRDTNIDLDPRDDQDGRTRWTITEVVV
jgi:hypothetical protein